MSGEGAVEHEGEGRGKKDSICTEPDTGLHLTTEVMMI